MKTDRLVGIIMLLLRHDRVSAKQLADTFEVSQRTIYRDLDSISRAGIPITATPGVNGGVEILPTYKADRKTFSSEELSTLLTGLNSLPGSLAGPGLPNALAKLRSLMPPEAAGKITDQAERFRFDWSPWCADSSRAAVFNVIRSALEESRLLHFTYVAIHSDRTERLVEPCQLILKGSSWYLYGFCRMRQDYRLFRLTRICAITVGGSFSPRPFPQAELNYETQIRARQQEILLKVRPEILDRLLDHCSVERVEWQEGCCLVHFPFIPNDYYYDMLLSFGSGCECLQPESVRQELVGRIKRLEELYK